MPRPIPFPVKQKRPETPVPDNPVEARPAETVPEVTPPVPQPVSTPLNETVPSVTPAVNIQPAETAEQTDLPAETPQTENIPAATPDKQEMPSDYIEENCVVINDKKIEIKPTKVRYFRNKTAATYNAMKNIPLTDLFAIKAGVLDETRDGDQIVYDFLIAALNDRDFVRDNYNNMDADQVERIVQIFGRINHIDEKYDAQRKNREAQGSR